MDLNPPDHNFLSVRKVRRGSLELLVADTHREFWDKFEDEAWEPETLAVFEHYLTPSTVHLDIGAWIGPTVLFAASKAARVLAFEPDPVAFASLRYAVDANPHLSPVELYPVAIAGSSGHLTLGSKSNPGDSMSSILFSDGPVKWNVKASRIEDFEHSWPADAPVFMKIDIEGGEYELLPALADFIRRRRPTIHLSLHGKFFLGDKLHASLPVRTLAELRLFAKFLRFLPVVRSYKFVYDSTGQPVELLHLLQRNYWRHTPSLVFANTPLADV